MSVDILMATYNGEKYIKNQLLSLQQQTYSNWTLWVRDDGSTDATLSIIDQFVENDLRVKKVTEGSGEGLKAGKNFLGLTKFGNSKYSIFCDQDDIWFEKKLEILINFAEKNFLDNVPSLVFCDAFGYSDKSGIIVSQKVWLWYAKNVKEFLFFNSGYQGCNILFNNSLNELAKNYKAEYFYMHDDVISLLAHVFGKVYFIKKQLMLYRQHDNNVTGNITINFFSRLALFFRKNAFVLSSCHFNERKAFFYAYESLMKDCDRQLFRQYVMFGKSNLIGRLLILINNDFSLGGKRIPLYIKTILRRPIE